MDLSIHASNQVSCYKSELWISNNILPLQPDGASSRCLDCPADIQNNCPYSAVKIYLEPVQQVRQTHFEGKQLGIHNFSNILQKMNELKSILRIKVDLLIYEGNSEPWNEMNGEQLYHFHFCPLVSRGQLFKERTCTSRRKFLKSRHLLVRSLGVNSLRKEFCPLRANS